MSDFHASQPAAISVRFLVLCSNPPTNPPSNRRIITQKSLRNAPSSKQTSPDIHKHPPTLAKVCYRANKSIFFSLKVRKNADNTERAEQAVDTTVCFYTPAKNTPPHRERKRFSIENHALWERSTTFDNSYLGPGKGYQLLLPFEITKNVPKDPLSIDVTYKDSANAPYDKTFHLDFTKAEGYTQIGDPSIDSIASSLRGIYNILLSRFPRQ